MENQEKFGNLHLQLSLMKIPMQMWIFFPSKLFKEWEGRNKHEFMEN